MFECKYVQDEKSIVEYEVGYLLVTIVVHFNSTLLNIILEYVVYQYMYFEVRNALNVKTRFTPRHS